METSRVRWILRQHYGQADNGGQTILIGELARDFGWALSFCGGGAVLANITVAFFRQHR